MNPCEGPTGFAASVLTASLLARPRAWATLHADEVRSTKNAYTSWGDYYLMEALAKRIHGVTGYW